MRHRLMAFCVTLCLATSLVASSSASILTVDTNPNWDGSINNGWLGSGQSITITNGFETFDDIGFYFHADSDGREFDFVLTDALNGGNTLLSTSFVVDSSGINVISIGLTLSAGSTYYASMGYRGFSGRTAHFSYIDSYAGGQSLFGPLGSQTDGYPTLDHRFIANFSGGGGVVPEPTSLLVWSALGICGIVSGRRRRFA
jgi:hypothetical protein